MESSRKLADREGDEEGGVEEEREVGAVAREEGVGVEAERDSCRLWLGLPPLTVLLPLRVIPPPIPGFVCDDGDIVVAVVAVDEDFTAVGETGVIVEEGSCCCGCWISAI